jgi:hypothetical protein
VDILQEYNVDYYRDPHVDHDQEELLDKTDEKHDYKACGAMVEEQFVEEC